MVRTMPHEFSPHFSPAELLSFPTFPHQNNVFDHNGWPGLDAFSCNAENVTGATNVSCEFAVIEEDNIKGEVSRVLCGAYGEGGRQKFV